MSNYLSVSIGNDGEIVESTSGPAMQNHLKSQSDLKAQGDQRSVQPKNMRVTASGSEISISEIKGTQVRAGGASGLPGSLSTMQNEFGQSISDLHGLDLSKATIAVSGSRCSVKTAMDMGLVVRDGNGMLHATDALEQMNAKSMEKPVVEQSRVIQDTEHLQVIDQMKQRVGAGHLDNYIANVAALVTSGKSADSTIAAMSEMAGCTEESLLAWTNDLLSELMSSGLAQVIGRDESIDVDDLLEWVQELPAGRQAALLVSAWHGDASAFKWVKDTFKSTLRKPRVKDDSEE